MTTATIFYIVFTLMLVCPLVLFNLKKFKIKKPGKPARINIPRIAIVSVLSILIIFFMYSLCQFSYDYQALLVGERYVTEFGKLRIGEISKQEFFSDTEKLAKYDPEKAKNITAFIDALPADANSFSYQLSDEVMPKYFEKETAIFKPADNDSNTIYIFVNGKAPDDEAYLLLMRRENYQWKIEDFYPTTQDAIKYAKSNNFLRGDQVVKWFNVTKKS